MKRIILTIMLLLPAISFADDHPRKFWLNVDVAGEQWDNNSHRYGTNQQFGYKITDQWSVDVSQMFRVNPETDWTFQRLGVGASYKYKWFGVRVGIGQRYVRQGSNRFVDVTPSVNIPWTDKLSTSLSYTYRTSDPAETLYDTSNSVRFGASYKVSDALSLNAGVNRAFGAQNFVSPSLGVTMRF
jgi:hypothetical protein